MTHTPTFDDFSVRLDELGLFHMDLTLDRMAAFFKRHFKFYSTLLNSEVGEVYFWAGRERVEFDPWTIRQVVAYPFGVRDPDLATLEEKEAALVIAEAL